MIGLSSFKDLYRRYPVIPSSFLPLVYSLGPGSAKTGMCIVAMRCFAASPRFRLPYIYHILGFYPL